MNDADVLARLHELGLELPAPPPAIAAYVPVVVHGSTASVAGQVAMVDGEVLHPGVVGDRVSIDEARQAAARVGYGPMTSSACATNHAPSLGITR